jgi:hypothetical protein
MVPPAEAAPPVAEPGPPVAEPAPPVAEAAPPVAEPAAAAPSMEALSEDEKKLHNDAKRLARVLISDILIYNEAKVVTGRKNKNLYGLLKEDIDRSKQLYEQKVSPKVASVSNYFFEEMINTLAQGDASALKGCPGIA